MPVRTQGRLVMPHWARNGALEATAVLPAITSGRDAARGSLVRLAFPASASTRAIMLADPRLHLDRRERASAPAADRRAAGRRCGPRRCESCAGCFRATSAPPPHLAEALGRRRRQIALAEPGAAPARCSSARGTVRIHPPSVRRAPSRRPSGPPCRRSADGVITQAKARNASLSSRFCFSRASVFLTSERSSSRILGMSILTGQTSRAGAAEAGGEGQRRARERRP